MKRGKKTEQVFEFIKTYSQKNGFPPSVRDIGASIKVSSTATVQYHIDKLVNDGLIKRVDSKNRTLVVATPSRRETELEAFSFEESPRMVSIPLVGKVAAGLPMLATENIEETYSLPFNFFSGKNLFMLTVKGESMIEAGIFPKDKIIVEKTQTANNGEIVIALLEDEATVKRIYFEKDHVRLQPENSQMKPIIVKGDVNIQGRVVGLIRNIR